MANVRCPMCSKLNPPEAEVCSYCGARIKPLRPSFGGQAGAESSSNDEPDWLKDLRTDQPSSQTGGNAPKNASDGPAEDANVPDWLSRIRDRARTETSSTPALFDEGKEQGADWLKEQGDASQGDASADQGLDDWLSRLPGGDTTQATPPAQPQKPAEPAPAEPSASGLEMGDWLRGLSDEGASEAQTSADNLPAFDLGTPSETGASDDDWMSKLSAWQSGFTEDENKPAEQAASEKPGAPQQQGEYDWLSGLGAENEPSAELLDQGFGSGTGLTDFFSNLEGQPEEQPPAQNKPQSAFPDEGGLQWGEPEPPAAHEKPSSGFGLTGFLSSLEEPEGTSEQTPPAGDMSEDVFTGWDQPAESAAPSAEASTPAFTESGGDMPDWMSDGPSKQPFDSAPEASQSGVPDWLKGLEDGTAAQAAEAAPAESLSSDESGVPDWLRGAGAEQPSEAVSPFEGEPSGLPSWLSSDAETPAQPQEQPFTLPEEPSQTGKSDLPAWLFEEETPGQPASTSAEPAAQTPAFTGAVEENLPADSGIPDWLSSDFASAEENAAGNLPTAETLPTAAELPAAGEAQAAEELPGFGEMPAAEEQPTAEELPGAETGAGLPDWFASFNQSEIEKTQPSRVTGALKPPSGQLPPFEGAPAQAEEPAEESEGPDWLRDFQGLKEETGETVSPLLSSARALDSAGQDSDQPFAADLPDWLSEGDAVIPAESQQAEARSSDARQQPTEAAGEPLAQAELPDWVRGMRPLESILPGEGEAPVGETDQRVEKAGPLAGMRGVLPVEEMATRYRKPPIYSVKLHVTEKQRSQAALLESILSQESQSLLIPPARAAGPGVLLRVLLTMLILVVLVFPVFFNIGLLAAPAPERFPAENQMFEMIDKNLQSSSNRPVLLVVEYEPGLSGEMRMTAEPVVAQLVGKNAKIVLVSTVAAGPAMGQQLVGNVPKDNIQPINLGYLPGGTISLVGFANQPWWVAPVTLEGKPAWGPDKFLKDVKSLKDFSQVIVLTDRAEVGRAWVEQVKPLMGDVPLFMVASAQAAPLLQPYVESRQIAGMTSGMLGGAMYTQLAGQSNSTALYYLSAYQIGVVLAFVVVLVGGVVSSIMALIKRGDRDEE